ncbi:MAG: hypothetical protein FJ087_14400 [Deltaproteobacteria bacterium]|nr:hypothetical protein [Deltaproteobacteria bacterium]
MKRVLVCLFGLALVGGLVACGGGGGDETGANNPDAAVTDVKQDVKTDVPKLGDVKQEGTTDTTPVPDTKIDNPPPKDEGTNPDTTIGPDQATDTYVKPDPTPDTTGNDPGPETNPIEYGTCKWFYDCANQCPPPPNQQACVTDCQNETSSEGFAGVQAFETCMDQNGCYNKASQDELIKCLSDFCMDEYFKCFSGTLYATCTELWACFDGCPPEADGKELHDQCVGNCWDGATYEANWDHQHLVECLFENCPICEKSNPTPAEDQQCVTCQNETLGTGGPCNDHYKKCAASGTQTCSEIFQCINTCADTACAQGCRAKGTFAAQDKLLAIFDCFGTTCEQFDNDEQAWSQCANEALTGACKAQADACEADA